MSKNSIIALVAVLSVIALTLVLYFVLKAKNKLPEFLKKTEPVTDTEIQTILSDTTLTNTERETKTRALQTKINTLLPEGYTKLEVDGAWGSLTAEAYELVKDKINSNTAKKLKNTIKTIGSRTVKP